MVSREALYRDIINELKMEDGLKARVIAHRLSVERREVNSILYSRQYRRAFRQDGYYKWHLVEERKTKRIILDPKPVVVKQKQEEPKPSCKKCMFYKNDICFGAKSICEDFKNCPEIPAYEMELWPKEMSGPYGTLHKNYQ